MTDIPTTAALRARVAGMGRDAAVEELLGWIDYLRPPEHVEVEVANAGYPMQPVLARLFYALTRNPGVYMSREDLERWAYDGRATAGGTMPKTLSRAAHVFRRYGARLENLHSIGYRVVFEPGAQLPPWARRTQWRRN